jgi:atypical dual specificity phosphatase
MTANYNNLWWVIPNVLAGMGIPYIEVHRRLNFGGTLREYSDDLPLLYDGGIRAVACLLDTPSDEKIFRAAGFNFKCIPVPDGCAPTVDQADEFICFINENRQRRNPVAVFCEAGLGRTGTMLATYLMHEGKSAQQAIDFIRSLEPAAIETYQQTKFLVDFENQIQSFGNDGIA